MKRKSSLPVRWHRRAPRAPARRKWGNEQQNIPTFPTLRKCVDTLREEFPTNEETGEPFLYRGEPGIWDAAYANLRRLLKANAEPRFEVREQIVRLTGSVASMFHSYLVEIDPVFPNAPKWFEYDMTLGLVQHYGLPTPCVDFTSSLDVAARFACNTKGGDVASIGILRATAVDNGSNQSYLGSRVVSNSGDCVISFGPMMGGRPAIQKAYGYVSGRALDIMQGGGDGEEHNAIGRLYRAAAADHTFMPNLKSQRDTNGLEIYWVASWVTNDDREYFGDIGQLTDYKEDRRASWMVFLIDRNLFCPGVNGESAIGKRFDETVSWILNRIPIVPHVVGNRRMHASGNIIGDFQTIRDLERIGWTYDEASVRECLRNRWSELGTTDVLEVPADDAPICFP